MVFEIRPAAPADAGGIAAVWRATTPQLVKTAAGVETELRSRRHVVAAGPHGLIGCASVWLPDGSRLAVQVPPRHRRQGVGSALVEAITEVARSAGAERLRTVVADDAEARDFAVRRGFSVGRRLSFARAMLAEIPEPVPAPDGVAVVSYDQLSDPRLIWQASVEVSGDDPSGLSSTASYEEWLAAEWNHPDLAKELSVAVMDGERVVSFASTSADRDRGAVWSDLTGTLPAYRGRGLAKVVKSAALVRCRDAGMTEALTGNDADNQPMLAVNHWLGYRPAGSQWTAGKTL